MKTQTLTLLPALKWLALALLTLPAPAPAQWLNDPWNGMVAVCTAPGEQEFIRLCTLAGGKTMEAWCDNRTSTQQVYYQILSSIGMPLLETNGRPVFEGNWSTGWGTIEGHELVPDGAGGCIAVLADERNGNWDIYGQRFDSLGNKLWGENGLPLAVWPGSDDAYLNDVTADSLGNVFIAWARWQSNIYVQKITTSGQLLWGNYGIRVCGIFPFLCGYQEIVADGQGGVIDIWLDNRPSGGPDPNHFFAQHLNPNGSPLWAVNGIPVRDPHTGALMGVGQGGDYMDAVPDGLGGGIWSFDNIWNWYLFRLDGATGQVFWLYHHWQQQECYAGDPLYHPSDGSLWVCPLENHQGQGWGSYLYRFDAQSGQSYFGNAGLLLPGFDLILATLAPGSNGVIAINSANQTSISYIRGLRVDNSGTIEWRSDISLWNGGMDWGDISCISDNSDGFICAWTDWRNWTISWLDIFAQRIRSDGSLGNPLPPYPYAPDYPRYKLAVIGPSVILTLPKSTNLRLELYDILGRKVDTLFEGFQQAGAFHINFDRQDLPTGVYLMELTTPCMQQVEKIIVTK